MNTSNNNSIREQGAALVTALILLLVMTVLGVSTMSTTTMEMRMAANDQFAENAFQLAETGLDTDIAELNTGAQVAPAATNPGNCTVFSANQIIANLDGTFSTRNCYIGEGIAYNSSAGVVNNYYFQNDSQARAQGASRLASSLQSRGMSVIGPAGL